MKNNFYLLLNSRKPNEIEIGKEINNKHISLGKYYIKNGKIFTENLLKKKMSFHNAVSYLKSKGIKIG